MNKKYNYPEPAQEHLLQSDSEQYSIDTSLQENLNTEDFNYYEEDTLFHEDNLNSEDEEEKSNWYSEEMDNYYASTLSYPSHDANLNLSNYTLHTNKNYYYQYQIRDKTELKYWYYINPHLLSDSSQIQKLGTFNFDKWNFTVIKYGKGSLYLHTTPVVFTNFYMVEQKNLEYTAKVFSYLQQGDVIWDEFSRTYNSDQESNPNYEMAGPLQFIVSKPPLRWAWYILLCIMLLFIIFRSRRTQQIIPLVEPNINKSLEFIQAIGRLYFMAGNHKQLIEQRMKLLLNHIKERYQLKFNEINNDVKERIIMKSQLPDYRVNDIFSFFNELSLQESVSKKELTKFYQLSNYFYKNCK